MIQQVVAAIEQVREHTHASYQVVCRVCAVSYSSFMRWRKRILVSHGPAVQPPGPKKSLPLPLSELQQELGSLSHGKKRSAGTGTVYQRFASAISRREFRYLVRMTRFDYQVAHRRNLRRIHWQAPGAVWAMDDTEYERDDHGTRHYLHHLRDLGAKYSFTPIAGAFACGDEVAAYLDHHFRLYGAPLVIKRDNGGNLNHQAVDELLSAYGVIPLNSPTYYPPYNGAIEKGQQELKGALRHRLSAHASCPKDHLEAYAESAAYAINHEPRRCLQGKIPCQVFFGEKENYRFTKSERRTIFDCIKMYAEKLLATMKDHTQKAIEAAWRIAMETWLRTKGIIQVSINGKVLPHLEPF